MVSYADMHTTHTDRRMLQGRRLQAATVRWQLDTVAGAGPLSLSNNYNRKLGEDLAILLMAPHLFRQLNEEAHHHLSTSTVHKSCGKAVVCDGCEKLRFERCACINQQVTDLQAGCAAGTVKWWTGFCPNTPLCGDKERRCAGCIAAGRHPDTTAGAPPALERSCSATRARAAASAKGGAYGGDSDLPLRPPLASNDDPDPDYVPPESGSDSESIATVDDADRAPVDHSAAPSVAPQSKRQRLQKMQQQQLLPRPQQQQQQSVSAVARKSRVCSAAADAGLPSARPSTGQLNESPRIVRIVDDTCGSPKLYEVAWSDTPIHDTTWESAHILTERGASELLSTWEAQCAQVEATWTQNNEEFLRTEPAPEGGDSDGCEAGPSNLAEQQRMHTETRTPMRLGKEIKFSKCGLRCGTRYAHVSGGVAFTICAGCGFLFPPALLFDAESTRMILHYLVSLFQDYPYARLPVRGPGYEELLVLFDDACHLKRMAISMRDHHPGVKRLLDEATLLVDKFHFIHNHKGKWCDANVNPLTNPSLQAAAAEGGINTQVCEQRFKYIAGYKYVMRNMTYTHFWWYALMITRHDHYFRAMGLRH